MEVTYDAGLDALHIRYIETTVTAEHVVEGITVGYAADGRVAGVEILGAREHFGDAETVRRVVLEKVALAALATARQRQREGVAAVDGGGDGQS